MTPNDAIDIALEAVVVRDAPNRPGALVARLPRDVQDGLARATSDDWAKRRVEFQATKGDKR